MDSLSDLKWSLKSPNSFSSAVHLTFKNSAVLIKLPWSSAVIYKRKVCVTFWWNASSRLHETSLHRNDIAVSCVILKLNRGTCNILRDTWENQTIPVHFLSFMVFYVLPVRFPNIGYRKHVLAESNKLRSNVLSLSFFESLLSFLMLFFHAVVVVLTSIQDYTAK